MEGRDTILLVQSRFHTNQYPLVKAFLAEGHDVRVLAHWQSEQEVHDTIQPDLIQFSPLFLLAYSFVSPFVSKYIRYRFSFPSLRWYVRYLRSVDPDLIIVKHYVVTSIITMLLARRMGIDIVFYDQEPVYGEGNFYAKRRITSALYYLINGDRLVRISPVFGDSSGDKVLPRSYYVPFVADPDVDATAREYCEGDRLSVMMVGKLHHERKEHLLLLEAIDELSRRHNVELTIIGTLNDPDDDYYQRVLDFIESRDLEGIVDIKTNLSYHEVQAEYQRHDVFVLPSRDEPAAVSPLEAMNNGLPVICSDSNGTRCYVEERENGYVFNTGNVDDLIEKLESIIASEETIRSFGERSLELVEAEYTTARFYERMTCLVTENFESYTNGESYTNERG